MQTDCVRYSSLVKKEIKRVAVCGGSGSFLLAIMPRQLELIFLLRQTLNIMSFLMLKMT